MCKESVRKELVCKELVRKELVRKELVRKELVRKELVRKELVRKELVRKELVRENQRLGTRMLLRDPVISLRGEACVQRVLGPTGAVCESLCESLCERCCVSQGGGGYHESLRNSMQRVLCSIVR